MEDKQKIFKILQIIERWELNTRQFCTFSFEEQDVYRSCNNIYAVEETQDGSCFITYTDIIFRSKERLKLYQGWMYIAIFIEDNDECAFGEQDFPPCDYKLNNQEKFGGGTILLYEFYQ